MRREVSVWWVVLAVGLLAGIGCTEPQRDLPGDVGADSGPCTPGETMQRGCNTCQCSDSGQWMCTLRACVDVPLRDIGGPSDTAMCQEGETKKVACNTCQCLDGSWACTERACVDIGPPDVGGDAEEGDSAPAPGDGGDTAESGDAASTYGCGGLECRRGREYCKETVPGVRPPDGGTPSSNYQCVSFEECSPNPDCECLTSKEGAGSTCTRRGDGAFEVTVYLP